MTFSLKYPTLKRKIRELGWMDMKEDNVCHVSFKKRYENVEGILLFTRQSSSLKVILFDLGRTIIYEKAL